MPTLVQPIANTGTVRDELAKKAGASHGSWQVSLLNLRNILLLVDSV